LTTTLSRGRGGPTTSETNFRAAIFGIDFAEHLRDHKAASYERWRKTYDDRHEFVELVLCQIGIELERRRAYISAEVGFNVEYDGKILPPIDRVYARLAKRFGKVTMPEVFKPFEPVAVRWVRECSRKVANHADRS
jgi:hypothetical protein